MVNFDAKGQGFWDFILDNCSPKFIEAVEVDLFRKDWKCEIIDVRKKEIGGANNITVLISSLVCPIIHEMDIYSSGSVMIQRYFMPSYHRSYLEEMGVI